ncbi:hypothetical protein [Thalassospira sp. ER-Se-21-Dark]|uniref:hypothetical protein n=1 Tax=Thalassospira sp. ER-Se-21-Dark TaxID=2585190 RepID=UPI001B303876|nr:hypothetical protein [Thalassospira sp. ER-Se-21-Dark]MBP3125880.1 hypothetical protein [Thalassospira sp. ER-Se-21-Dark]
MQQVSRFSNELSFLKPAFEQFSKNLSQYGQTVQWSELPHYFNERATISLLQAACWQAKLVSFEEYVTKKRKGEDLKNGRCDLYVSQKRGDRNIEFEAKERLLVSRTSDDQIRSWLKEGDNDAACNEAADIRASLTFVMPRVPEKEGVTQETHIALVQNALDVALSEGIHAAHFWCHPRAWDVTGVPRRGGVPSRWPSLLTLIRVVSVNENYEFSVGPNCLTNPISLS